MIDLNIIYIILITIFSIIIIKEIFNYFKKKKEEKLKLEKVIKDKELTKESLLKKNQKSKIKDDGLPPGIFLNIILNI
jgi:hypothetical protein